MLLFPISRLTSDLGGPPPIFDPILDDDPNGLGADDVGSEFGPLPSGGGPPPEFLSMLRKHKMMRIR